MELYILGVNHRTAPIDLRERLAFAKDDLPLALQKLVASTSLTEVVLLNTCNRVEIIGAAEPDQRKQVFAELRDFVGDFHHVAHHEFASHLYEFSELSAVEHLFSVACSLDSMVVGEPQILGQVKAAFKLAKDAETVGGFLETCFSRCFRAAKRVRSQTGIAKSTVSISHVAIDLAKRIFGKLEKSTVLLIGAGKMGQLAASRLRDSGANDVIVVNRRYERGKELADKMGWQASVLDDLPLLLPKVDIVIVSTDARNYVLTPKELQNIACERRYRPLFIVDISVPRNVDPEVHEIEGVFLYDIDNLEEISATHRDGRLNEVNLANAIMGEEVQSYLKWRDGRAIGAIIASLMQNAESIRQLELERTLSKLGEHSPELSKMLDEMTRALTRKLLHHPIHALKNGELDELGVDKMELVARLFKVDPPPPSD